MAKIHIVSVNSYGILAVLFASCMLALSQTPVQKSTKLGNGENATTPVLDFLPKPENKSTVILIGGSNGTRYESWEANLMSSLEPYYLSRKLEKGSTAVMSCSYDLPPVPGKVCNVDPREWGPCNPELHFNYNTSEPCIFLKLETIYGWVPEYYNDPDDLPDDMPQKLKDYIHNERERNNIWISCDGATEADKILLESVKYYPFQGFPGYYYPYKKIEGYLSPLVAVRFKGSPTNLHLNIECTAWAKNINYGRHERNGPVRFQIHKN